MRLNNHLGRYKVIAMELMLWCKKLVVQHRNLRLVVYMGNNYVCDHLYTGEHLKAVRFLLENPDPKELQDLMQRRNTTGVAALGLTLDYYGAQYASRLAHCYVFEEMRQRPMMQNNATWAYLPFPGGKNPSMCELSTSEDGRHYQFHTSGN